ncbi:MAG: Putative carboxymuconolactone decarboxylase family protein [Fluviibacter phosphoraccumulans EoVTN8]
MSEKSFKTVTQDLSKGLAQFRVQVPEVQAAFSALHKASMQDGALDAKTKELIALAIGVAARCDGCIGFHTQALIKLGVTKAELTEMLGVTVMMGGGPSLMYAGETMRAFEEFGSE